MKIRKNGVVINLTESDLRRITKRVMNEDFAINSPKTFDHNLDKLKLKRIVSDVYNYCKGTKNDEYKDLEMCRKTLQALISGADMLYSIIGGGNSQTDTDPDESLFNI